MKHDRFTLKNGQPTAYALACGYAMSIERGGIRVQAYAEHGALHVCTYDHNNGKRLAWECPEGLTAFRREYARQCREFLPAKVAS